MTELSALWVPVLLSAVIVFVVSSIVHMVLPWHKSDYPQAPNEDKLRDAVRPLGIPPGDLFRFVGTTAFIAYSVARRSRRRWMD